MDPFTFWAIALLIAGTAMQAYGQYQAGEAAEAEARNQQAILEYNAKIEERRAEAERKRAEEEARQFEREGKALLGEQQVGLAKGGVLTSIGTPALLLEETAQELEADRNMILQEGLRAESLRLSEAEGLRFKGRAARARGANLKTGYRYQAAGTLLTGLGTAAGYGSFGGTTKSPYGGGSLSPSTARRYASSYGGNFP